MPRLKLCFNKKMTEKNQSALGSPPGQNTPCYSKSNLVQWIGYCKQGADEMEQARTKLWSRDFILIQLVQLIALFAKAMLRFALPLYVLEISGSPALFGTVMALGAMPLVLMAPFGGVLADRFKRQEVIFWVDTITAILILVLLLITSFASVIVWLMVLLMMLLSAFQGVYTPTAMSCVPMLVPPDKLAQGNAIGSMVFSLGSAAGPAIAGVLYVDTNLTPVLIVAFACFAVTATIVRFIRIPYQKQAFSGKIFQTAKSDLSRVARLAVKEKPSMGKAIGVKFLFGISTSGMILVTMPVLVTQTLGLDNSLLGLAQGFSMLGGLFGGFLAGALRKWISIRGTHRVLFLSGLLMLPGGLSLLLGGPVFLT